MAERTRDLIYRTALDRSWWSVTALIVLLMVVAWSMTFLAGGASSLPPHAFYVPIVIAGIRFGILGAIVTGLVCGLLAGPLLPSDVAAGEAQSTSDWVGRTAFYVVIGAVITELLHVGVESARRGFETLAKGVKLRAAISGDQLELHYQPVISVPSGDVVGAEALVRWNHPTRGQIGPSEFIAFAEAHSVIEPLGEWVLTTAFEQLVVWERAGQAPLSTLGLAVNASRRQFTERGHLLATLDRLLEREATQRVRLAIEITETALADDNVVLLDQLMQVRLRGVQIAIDDFGVGHSSLMTLRDLPFDHVKIDQTFVQGAAYDQTNRTIVANTIQLARQLGKQTVAEGVETAEQYELLVELGIDYLQGYYIAEPMPLADFERWAIDHQQQVGATPDRSTHDPLKWSHLGHGLPRTGADVGEQPTR